MREERSLTEGFWNKATIAFWGLLILNFAFAIGRGPLLDDIAHVAYTGIFVLMIARIAKPHAISYALFNSLAALLTVIGIGVAVVGNSLNLVLLGVCFIVLYSLCNGMSWLVQHAGAVPERRIGSM